MQKFKMILPTIQEALISIGAGAIGVFLTKIFGEFNDVIFALITLMVIDFITGLFVAAIFNKSTKTFNGGLSSKVCIQGIVKKIAILLLVAVGYQIERLLNGDYPIKIFVSCGLCVGEIISIIENAVAMEILPKNVQKILEKAIGLLNKKNEWLIDESEDDV